VTDLDPQLLRQYLSEEPFVSVGVGDTVILCIDGTWEKEQVLSLGTYLEEWAPKVKWQALYDPGFTGVIHIRAEPAETTG
jgi:hypothetical protein